MLPAAERLYDARRLIDLERYFVLHAPRQTGKTTTVAALVASLNAEGRYTSLLVSCEEAQAAGDDINRGIGAILTLIEDRAAVLPEPLRPPSPESFADVDGISRLGNYLTGWAESSPRPVVLFLDEIDAVMGKTLISVLRQLRAGYPDRPARFPQSVALVGMRDVRDYRLTKVLLANFTAEEVATFLEQHTADSGQIFTAEVKAGIWELTRGQPWLVNALAQQLVDVEVPDRGTEIERQHLEAAKEALIQRRDTHIDSLLARLRDKRVRGVVEPLLAGEYLEGDVMDDDIQFTEDLGLVVSGEMGLQIANPIYREIVPRVLTSTLEKQLRVTAAPYVADDGRLLFDRFLDEFRAFWLANAEFFLQRQPYSEAAAELIFMAYLHKLINGGGYRRGTSIDREFAVGCGRIDLLITWPLPGGERERFAVELKVWRRDRDPDPLDQGLEQLGEYLDRLDLAEGTLIVFDRRPGAASLPERTSRDETVHQGHRITVLRL
jgi:hypothetical protein